MPRRGLRCTAFPRAQNRLLLPVLAGHMPPLPHWPGVQIVDAKGQVLWVRPASLLDSWGAPDPARLRTHRVVVPPPQSVPVLVQDTNGKPIAGAELWRAFDLDRLQPSRWMAPAPPAPSWRRHGVSDGDGRATIEVAILVQGGKVFADELMIEARVPGRALACAGITSVGGTFDNHPSHDVVADGVLRITVDEPERLRVHPPTACRLEVIGRLGNAPLARGEQGP